jgi:dTDP-4-amino-4,6-dideoxygalactose transaminase
MVDLIGQYQRIKDEVDEAVLEVISSAQFIKGPAVKEFEANLAEYLGVKHVIGCANGTDALQIALMALDLVQGDEIIVPSFTYVATAEVIALLKLRPVMVDVDPNTFNVTPEIVEAAITPSTRAIVPVHLFGQSCDMEGIIQVAQKYGLKIIEDNAQALGADYTFPDGSSKKTGTMGDIGCTSFFPSKNLGCYGDGGALFTNDDQLADKIKMIANHGQKKKYYHAVIGCNSRLDSIQAAVLNVKLKHLDDYAARRQAVASAYDDAFEDIHYLKTPKRNKQSTHVFHQYTLKVQCPANNTFCENNTCGSVCQLRDLLKKHLDHSNIPNAIYYPVPLYKQEAFSSYYSGEDLPHTEAHCHSVLSLPIHTEMDADTKEYIISCVRQFFETSNL